MKRVTGHSHRRPPPGLFGLAMVSALVPAIAFAQLLLQTPGMILFAAAVPPVTYALLLTLFDHEDRKPWYLIVAAFLWGAVIASFLSTVLNEYASSWITTVAAEEHSRRFTPLLAAPVIEELSKAAALVLLLPVWRGRQRAIRRGIVYGALVGLGFDVAENINYFTLATVQGGSAGLAQSVYVRAFLGGFKHATFTATAGAGLGVALEAKSVSTRLFALAVGLSAAIGQHIVWNAIAAQTISDALCDAAIPDGPCRSVPSAIDLFVTVPLIALVAIGPGALTLLLVARRRRDV